MGERLSNSAARTFGNMISSFPKSIWRPAIGEVFEEFLNADGTFEEKDPFEKGLLAMKELEQSFPVQMRRRTIFESADQVQERIHDWRRDRGSAEKALLVYYWLHVCGREEAKEFAGRIDARIFDDRNFEAAFNVQVPISDADAKKLNSTPVIFFDTQDGSPEPNANLRLIRNLSKATAELLSFADEIVEIRNTHIDFDKTEYSDQEMENMKKLFFTVLENGGEVFDYFGGNKKTEALKQHQDISDDILKSDHKEGYHCVKIEADFPFLNFILLTKINNTRVVYFGWGGLPLTSGTNLVFQSEYEPLVECFSLIHTSIQNM